MRLLRHRPAAALIGVAALLTGAGACSHAAAVGTTTRNVTVLPPTTLPSTLLDLSVTPESVRKELAGNSATYASAVGFWSLRQNKTLQASVEVTKLGPSARLSDPGFRADLVSSVLDHGGVPSLVGTRQVLSQTGTSAITSTWLDGSYLFILNVRPTYAYPRGLLAEVARINL